MSEEEQTATFIPLSAPDLAHIGTFKTCPDCVCGQLRLGPRGGAAMNVRCSNEDCGHEFSITFMGGAAVMGERLDRNEPALYSEEEFV